MSYAISVTIYATAIVDAGTPEEAQALANKFLKDQPLEMLDNGEGEPLYAVAPHPEACGVRLSPAMQIGDIESRLELYDEE